MSRFARRVDGNHSTIVEALRNAGAMVQSLASVGGGVPDLLVGHNGRWVVMEVKDGSKPASSRRLTQDQVAWHSEAAQHGLPLYVVCTPEHAVSIL